MFATIATTKDSEGKITFCHLDRTYRTEGSLSIVHSFSQHAQSYSPGSCVWLLCACVYDVVIDADAARRPLVTHEIISIFESTYIRRVFVFDIFQSHDVIRLTQMEHTAYCLERNSGPKQASVVLQFCCFHGDDDDNDDGW